MFKSKKPCKAEEGTKNYREGSAKFKQLLDKVFEQSKEETDKVLKLKPKKKPKPQSESL